MVSCRKAGFALVLGVLTCISMAMSQRGDQGSRVTFSESWRKESKTVSEEHPGGSSSETTEASFAKWTLNFEIPITAEQKSKLEYGTRLTIQLGSLEFSSVLADDSGFTKGKTSARLFMTDRKNKNTNGTTDILATLNLKWDGAKMVGRMEGKGFKLSPLVASKYESDLTGDVKGIADAYVMVGPVNTSQSVIFSGKVNRKTVDAGSGGHQVSGFAATVDLKGDSKG